MVYRAINALRGKATLQDIVTWMRNEYEFYKYSDNNTWEVSGLSRLMQASIDGVVVLSPTYLIWKSRFRQSRKERGR